MLFAALTRGLRVAQVRASATALHVRMIGARPMVAVANIGVRPMVAVAAVTASTVVGAAWCTPNNLV